MFVAVCVRLVALTYLYALNPKGLHMDNDEKEQSPHAKRVEKAAKTAENPHVAHLTIGRATYNRGIKTNVTRYQAHELQFHLRRMWAITLLDNMQREGFTWDGIRVLTGKTRQTWTNVTRAGFVDYDFINSTSVDDPRRSEMFTAVGYRTISNTFIRNVCDAMESENYGVYTSSFRKLFDMGLSVWNNKPFLDDDFDALVARRLGPRGGQLMIEMKDVAHNVLTGIRNVDGDAVVVVEFPLLELEDRTIGGANAWEYAMDVELIAYGFEDEVTKEPSKLATTAHEWWEQQKDMRESGAFVEPPQPTDPSKFKGQSPVPLPDPIERPGSIIQADDGKLKWADIGGFLCQLPKIELLPQMANNQNQIHLNVVIQLDANGKPKTIVTTDKGGFMHIQG